MFSEAVVVLESFDCLLLSITCLLNIARKEKGAYAQDKSNIPAKASSQLLPQSIVVFKSGGGHTYGFLELHAYSSNSGTNEGSTKCPSTPR